MTDFSPAAMIDYVDNMFDNEPEPTEPTEPAALGFGQETDNTESLAEVASRQLMLVEMKRTGLTLSKSDKSARQRLATTDQVDDSQYRVSKVLLPAPYNASFKALKTALNLAYGDFIRTTMPYSKGADGATAAGGRVVTITQIMNDNWVQKMATHSREIDTRREAFAMEIPHLMQQMAADPLYSAQFDPDDYPTPEQIRESFKFTIDGPSPLPRFDYVPMTGPMGEALAKRFEVQQEKKLAFGQQQMAAETLDFVKNLAEQMRGLLEHIDGTRPKAPRLYESLTGNLQHMVAKIRQFAMPETDEGAALLRLADRVEANLVPEGRTVKDLRDNPALARAVATKATDIADDIADLDVLFD